MTPEQILSSFASLARGFAGPGALVGTLLEGVGVLVKRRGVEDAIGAIQALIDAPPHRANLDRMEAALEERKRREEDS